MAGSFHHHHHHHHHHQHRRYGRPPAAAKLWRLCPLWQSGKTGQSSSTASNQILHYQESHTDRRVAEGSDSRSPVSLSSVARSLLPPRRRLRLDPPNNLYFPYEPGKQVRSAVKIKTASKSHVAFKFQTTSPKSCYMRPPGGILAPGESLVATVFKFVEQPENNEKRLEQKCRVKFRIMSLKVAGGTEFVPELFDERKQEVVVECVLRVVFLDAAQPSAAMEKLKCQLSEAEASLEAHRKAPADTGPRLFGGLVIDEWKERREKYLARQQVEAVDSF